jgi:hypothetical protein
MKYDTILCPTISPEQRCLTWLRPVWLTIALLPSIWLCTLAAHVFAQSSEQTAPITPKDGVIQLFNGKDLDGLYTYLEDAKYEDPRQVFTIRDGLLVISGDGYGGVTTRQTYQNYHLVCEFKWGQRTWGGRKQRARDSGILVHCSGPDGSFSNKWLTSIESQIIEGGMGDLLVVGGVDEEGKSIPITLTAEVTTDRDGETVWEKDGEKQTFHRGRINWYGRDPDWQDVLGFCGANDIPDPSDGWTRMEVICNGSDIQILVNGVLVNEGTDINPSSGKITIQTEEAEIFVRLWELWPLDTGPTDKAQ